MAQISQEQRAVADRNTEALLAEIDRQVAQLQAHGWFRDQKDAQRQARRNFDTLYKRYEAQRKNSEALDRAANMEENLVMAQQDAVMVDMATSALQAELGQTTYTPEAVDDMTELRQDALDRVSEVNSALTEACGVGDDDDIENSWFAHFERQHQQ